MADGCLHVFWLAVMGCRGAMLLCPARAQSVAFSKNRPCPASGKGGPYAQQEAQRDVEEEGAVEALPEHCHALVAEGGEGGEASAKPRGE